MDIIFEKNDDALVVNISGRMDLTTAPSLEEKIPEIIAEKKVVLDLNNLDYLSSAGLRLILIIRKKMGGKPFILRNVNSDIQNILDMTGFSSIITIE